MALGSQIEDNFSRGIVRQVEGQRIPNDGVYDCVNGLLDDDLGIYRRGGAALKSATDAAATPLGLTVAPFVFGPTAVFWTNAGTYKLNGSNNPVLGATGAAGNRFPLAFRRVAFGNGLMAIPNSNFTGALAGDPQVFVWGGTSKSADYTTGTVTLSAGQVTVTGSGTSWTANIEPGMIFQGSAFIGDGEFAIVKSVESNTSLTLATPWTGQGLSADTYGVTRGFIAHLPLGEVVPYVAMVGSPPKLLAAVDSIVFVSNSSGAPDPFTFPTDQFHLLPQGSIITGIDAIRDTAVVFSTEGVWAISNLNYDLTDELGNPQQTVQQISKNVILWGDSGVAGWRGGLIVPAVDDVFMFSVAGEEIPISTAIRPLYRSYVKAGYQPGMASIYRGHYFLPIVNGTTWVDTLVCRLDGAQPGWTRWDGQAGSTAYAQEIGSTTRSPKVYGLSGLRVTDLSGAFEPAAGNKSDANGTAHVLTIVTRDFSLRAQVRNLWKYLRARFELTDAASDNPTVTAEYAVGPVAGESWTSIGSWAEGTGETPTKLSVGKRAQSIRFRLKTSGASSKFVLRSLEVFYRESGRL